tara:strand:+ start:165 stop:650 length:486 start_codon:yes stop_codon:yes gene_type:complete
MSKEYKFKSVGKKYEEAVKESNYSDRLSSKNSPIGIRTPLESGVLNNENLFKMNFTLEDQIEDNFKNLLLTRRGEKLGSNFGTSLREIFSLKSSEDIQEIAMSEISRSIEQYLPVINLIDSTMNEIKNGVEDELIYDLTIKYRIIGNNKVKSITVKLDTSG